MGKSVLSRSTLACQTQGQVPRRGLREIRGTPVARIVTPNRGAKGQSSGLFLSPPKMSWGLFGKRGKQMIIGFTGTRIGMTEHQKAHFRALIDLDGKQWSEFHHGDCVGADADADASIQRVNLYNWGRVGDPIEILIHPPKDSKHRAFCKSPWTTVLPQKNYLERNEDIVMECDTLVATPKETYWFVRNNGEPNKGGTWFTIKKAREFKKTIFIIYSDGEIEEDRGE